MAKKEKMGVDKIVKRVNKEFEKTSSQIETLLSDALRQLDTLQNQIQEPLRKLVDDMERIREREMKRFQDEFDRRMSEFHELQQTVLDKLGLAGARDKTSAPASKATKPSTSAATAKPAAPKAKPATKAATKTAKAPAKSKAAAAKPASTASKTAAAKKAPAPKKTTVNTSNLGQIKGLGPATAKKMKEAGITSIEQIANPSAEEKKKLEVFSSMKGYETWQAQARKLLG